ncbi:MAG: hypothetical protein Q4F13_06950 [Pseudomonadota bacterium]|nr:hypothetical protein [Pseudomonadota bacterium]
MFMDLTQARAMPLARPVLPVPRALARQYKGAGWVLVATAWGRMVHLAYVTDLSAALAQALQEDLTDTQGTALVRHWLRLPEALPHIREMQALGDVSAGRCAGWTYCPF